MENEQFLGIKLNDEIQIKEIYSAELKIDEVFSEDKKIYAVYLLMPVEGKEPLRIGLMIPDLKFLGQALDGIGEAVAKEFLGYTPKKSTGIILPDGSQV